RENCESREGWNAANHAQRMTKIVNHPFERSSPQVACGFLHDTGIPKCAKRSVARFLTRHSFCDVLVDLPLDVVLHLLIKRYFQLAATEHGTNAPGQFVEPML